MGETLTGTVTFLFTDVEGSTRLWEQAPDAMRQAMARHDTLIEACVSSNAGQLVRPRGEGDSRFAVFARATDAIAAARDIQQSFFTETWITPRPVRVRMALHTGQADLRAGDYYGSDVNRCARLRAIASGGQTLLSQVTFDLVRDAPPPQVVLRDLGEHRLKDLQRAEHVFELDAAGLPTVFPPLQSLDAFPNNLPVQLSSFVGREHELAEVKQVLTNTHLLTLTGPGGTGKTRLALQVAADVLPTFPHGVWFIDLAPVSDPALIPQAVAAVLSVREQPEHPLIDSLVDLLRANTALLILDNCEHLVEASARIAQAMLRACAKLRIISTSREALSIAGEAVYRVPSLAVPELERIPPLENFARLDAVRLFVERAATARSGFMLTRQNAPAIAQICNRLDGIPLAIELAASRVKVLSIEQIASRLDNRFQLLTGGSRTALPRQQTLRATIDWSYSLLSEPERVLFRRLAVFVNGWGLEAAEEVCADDEGQLTKDEKTAFGDSLPSVVAPSPAGHPPSSVSLASSDILDLLTRLVDKSLVIAEELAGESRYRRLETIRQYSREKFAETDEVENMRDRHLQYFVRFSTRAGMQLLSSERSTWTIRLEAEQDNLRAALAWGLARHPESALSMVGDLSGFWPASGYSAEGYRWTRQALERVHALPPPEGAALELHRRAEAKALCALAWIYISQGDNEQGRIMAEQSVALHRQDVQSDPRELVFSMLVLANALEFLGRRAEAETILNECATLARRAGEVYLMCWSLSLLARVTVDLYGDLDKATRYSNEGIQLARSAGMDYIAATNLETAGLIAAYRKDNVQARALFQQATDIFRAEGAPFNVTLSTTALAHMERHLGNEARALELYRETIVGFRNAGQRGAVAHQLECFGFITLAQNQAERAARLFSAAEALREQAGTPMTPDEHVEYQAQIDTLRRRTEPESLQKAWAQGRAMTMEEAIQYAIADKQSFSG